MAAKTSLDQLLVQYKCTVMDEINAMVTICSSNKSLYRDLPLYEDHKRRATAGEGRFGE